MAIHDIRSSVTTDAAVVASFDNHESVEAAVKHLTDAKFDIHSITVIGRGFHTEEHIAGFYFIKDRLKFWGKNGALWGSLWGLLIGGVFVTIPVMGPVVIVGYLSIIAVSAIEGGILIGGLSVLGAALYSIGIQKDSVLRYEQQILADHFLLMVHGTASEVEHARAILHERQPTEMNVHRGINMNVGAAQHRLLN